MKPERGHNGEPSSPAPKCTDKGERVLRRLSRVSSVVSDRASQTGQGKSYWSSSNDQTDKQLIEEDIEDHYGHKDEVN